MVLVVPHKLISNTSFPAPPTGSLASYSWTGPNGFTSNQQNPSLTITQAHAGTYSVSGVTATGCPLSSSISIAVKTAPIPQLGSNTDAVCENDVIVLSAFEGNSYLWTGPGLWNVTTPGDPINGGTASRYNLQEIHEGNYTVTVTGANGCTGYQSKYITVNDRPEPFLVSMNQVSCASAWDGSFEISV